MCIVHCTCNSIRSINTSRMSSCQLILVLLSATVNLLFLPWYGNGRILSLMSVCSGCISLLTGFGLRDDGLSRTLRPAWILLGSRKCGFQVNKVSLGQPLFHICLLDGREIALTPCGRNCDSLACYSLFIESKGWFSTGAY